MSDVQALAREAASWFETARRATGDTETGPREDGEEYVRLRDGRPEWVYNLVYRAHGEMLPDDWRYACIEAACEWIGESGDPEDSRGEFADGQADVYNGARFAWLSSNLLRAGYCDEATEEFGACESVTETIGRGQYMEAEEVYGLVLSALEARSEEVAGDA